MWEEMEYSINTVLIQYSYANDLNREVIMILSQYGIDNGFES
jgi:hypothetical protein